ncbi:uncharacterized protein M421DRAFT_200664 [Didymella exigua CBS 183.55]|uniref:Uncharacterized protein n=1 Tax=Didymella exigua CBS 183.55 TaxID=1150837 RepID=A0A6A5S134_9PLEO|nr:uncharacterized protein M421DRAFT_200664 [Didymella exigua CBS 183.55]KAF1933593.1 hypothetical protein M421DRAFT_200664 [Didymella exigua CBS 183.55]
MMIVPIASNKARLGRLSQAKPPHLSAPEISHCSFVRILGEAPRSRPDPGQVWASSDCIPDPPHSPPVPPFTAVQMAYPSPVYANPRRYSLKPLSRTTSVAFAHHRLAACESDVPCSICCMSIGLDLRTWSLYPRLFLLHNSRHPCPVTGHIED